MKKWGDQALYVGMRHNMVELLREKGITDERVLAAMKTVPRHLFVAKGMEHRAYQNIPNPIGEEQTISQPFTVATQSALLEIRPSLRVLEIGTGSGYQAAVLAAMGAEVVTVERIKVLYEKAKELLKKMAYQHIRCVFGDGHEGVAEFAPFDRIIITAATNHIPPDLVAQLSIGGMLVAPVGDDKGQQMYRLTKLSNEQSKIEKLENFRFVPMLKGKVDRMKKS